jgi:hypothetical protein
MQTMTPDEAVQAVACMVEHPPADWAQASRYSHEWTGECGYGGWQEFADFTDAVEEMSGGFITGRKKHVMDFEPYDYVGDMVWGETDRCEGGCCDGW